MRAGRRLGLVLLAGLVPWVPVVTDSSVSFVCSFGFVSVAPFHVTPIWRYLPQLSGSVATAYASWPVATFLYVLAVDSATLGWWLGREDRRLTGGLLVVAGLSLLPVVFAVGRPAGVTAVAAGTTVLWLVAWVGYRDALLRAVFGGGSSAER